jgi:hypothetical protein
MPSQGGDGNQGGPWGVVVSRGWWKLAEAA